MTTPLDGLSWLSDVQREILSKFQIRSLEALATFELKDSFHDVVPIDNCRALARRARIELGRSDPLAEIGQAAGHHGPVRHAGGIGK